MLIETGGCLLAVVNSLPKTARHRSGSFRRPGAYVRLPPRLNCRQCSPLETGWNDLHKKAGDTVRRAIRSNEDGFSPLFLFVTLLNLDTHAKTHIPIRRDLNKRWGETPFIE
jgi:hypothetical protein